MSTFDDDEKSIQDARPAHLYTITTPSTTYRLTSYSTDLVFGGNTYSAGSISCDSVGLGQIGQGRALSINVALSHALAQDLLVGGIPQKDVTVQIVTLMQRANATRGLWLGHVSDLATDDKAGVLKLRVPELVDDYVSVRLPVLVVQKVCQHGLYDAGCTMNPASFQVSTTLGSVSADGLTLTVSSMGGQPDQWAQYGKITDGGGEARSIVSQVGTAIVIDVPFRTTTPGGTYTINAGCDHTVQTCKTKFNNVINYGGHPMQPTVSPLSPVRVGLVNTNR